MKILALLFTLLFAIPAASPASAEDAPLKIGFLSTFSGGSALSGQAMLDGFKVGLKHLNGRLGGRQVHLILGDDQMKPDIGLQIAQKMIESDHVDLLTGMVLSNVMLAVTRAFEPAQIPFISLNAGPSPLAGKQCNKYFFADSYELDQASEAMGIYLNQQRVKNLFLLASNYQAGKDMITGLKRRYTGKILGEIMSPFGAMDYASEIAQLRQAKPDGVFFFYTNVAAINFLKQFQGDGLKDVIPLYATTFSLDQSLLPSVGTAADGILSTSMWGEGLDIPANRTFVKEYNAAYGQLPPLFAMTGYDGALLMNAALTETGGKTDNKDALIHAFETAKFPSVRGSFRFNTNHFPIQDFYLLKVSRDEQGRAVNKVMSTVVKDMQDPYVSQCPMGRSAGG